MKKKSIYDVIVGNIGIAHTVSNRAKAERVFADYVTQSKSGVGRSAYESVTLSRDGEPIKEFTPFDREIAQFAKEVQPYGKKIDPHNEHDWLSLSLGWGLAKGMPIEKAKVFAVYLRYNTDLA